MKVTPIAVAAIVPAVIAGAAFSAVPFAQAAAAGAHVVRPHARPHASTRSTTSATVSPVRARM